MKYLKVFTDFVEDLRELNDAEVGRLFKAMLLYAESGEVASFKGNERFVWPGAKKSIDKQNAAYSNRCEVNRNNASQRIAPNGSESQRIAAKGIESERNEANGIESLQEKEKEKEKDKEEKKNKKEIRYAEVREAFIRACPSLPRPNPADQWTDARKKAIRDKHMAVEELEDVFRRVEKSDFLSGRSGKWDGCSLDWILKPANWAKIVEGNYDNRKAAESGRETSYDLEAFTAMIESEAYLRDC